MIWSIAKRGFLSNVFTFRFSIGTLICLVLVALFAWVLTEDYEQGLRTHNKSVQEKRAEMSEVRVYAELKPTIYKPPEVLSIFSEGLEKQLGNSVKIVLGEVPILRSAAKEENPLLSVFPTFDFSLIVKVVMSILALLFAYDAISGEKEQGTLRQMLANSVPRHQILFGKLIGGLLSLMLPVLTALLVGLLIATFSPLITLTAADWARIGLIFLASLTFLSLLFNLGLLFSCLTKRPSVTLMWVLLLWAIFVIIVPNLSTYLASRIRRPEPREKIDRTIEDLWRRFDKERRKPFYRSSIGTHADARGLGGVWVVLGASRENMRYMAKRNDFIEHLRIKYASRVWELEHRYFTSLKEQKKIAGGLARISPTSIYENVVSVLSRTDLASFERFVERARIYRNQIIEYFDSKKIFSSLSYFSPLKEDDLVETEEEYSKVQDRYRRKKLEDFPPLDQSDFPQFIYKSEDITSTSTRGFLDLGLLIFLNILLFVGAFVAFLRYDPR